MKYMNDKRPENDHDAIVEIWVMMKNHLQHHAKSVSTWHFWVMFALALALGILGFFR